MDSKAGCDDAARQVNGTRGVRDGGPGRRVIAAAYHSRLSKQHGRQPCGTRGEGEGHTVSRTWSTMQKLKSKHEM